MDIRDFFEMKISGRYAGRVYWSESLQKLKLNIKTTFKLIFNIKIHFNESNHAWNLPFLKTKLH